MSFLKQYWSQLALFVAGVIIAFLIFGKCNAPVDRSAELKALQDSATVYKTIIGQQNAQKENLNKQLIAINKVNDSLNARYNLAKIDLSNKGKVLLTLSQQVQDAKQKKDTVSYFVNCDSLAAIAETEIAKTNYYIQLSDSLVQAHKKEMEVAHSLIVNRDSAFTEANNMLFATSIALGNQKEDNKKLLKQHSADKKEKKVLLAAIIIAAVKIFVFK